MPVADPEESAIFYTEKLGFTITSKWDNPIDFLVMNREEAVSRHLSRSDSSHQSTLNSPVSLYVFVFDIDLLYERVKRRE